MPPATRSTTPATRGATPPPTDFAPHLPTPGEAYRFRHPTTAAILADMLPPPTDLRPGERIRPFDLLTTEGGHVRSADRATDARPVLLVFGSRTCPVTESAAGGLRALHAKFGRRVRFVMVSVREAHPGATIGQPATAEQKLRHARSLKDHHALPFEVAMDDLDGTLHRHVGPRPNTALVIDRSGLIVFRAQWANQTAVIDDALRAIVAGQRPRHASVRRTLPAMARTIGYMDPVLEAAGKGAHLDTWKAFAPMGVMTVLARAFPFLPRERRGLPTMALLMVLTAGLAVALVLLLRR